MEWLQLGVLVVGAYLLGAIPFGLLISSHLGRDLRDHGSGKTGATNALRVIGRRAAGVIFTLDLAKGALAVGIARLLLWPDENWLGLAMGSAAAAAIIGHCWSLWIRLFGGSGKWGGGRGVATAIGVLLMVSPIAMIIGLGVGLAVIVVSRYVSLGSITGIAVGVLAVTVLVAIHTIPFGFLPWAVGCGLLVVVLHRDNIARLRNGTERKFGQRA